MNSEIMCKFLQGKTVKQRNTGSRVMFSRTYTNIPIGPCHLFFIKIYNSYQKQPCSDFISLPTILLAASMTRMLHEVGGLNNR